MNGTNASSPLMMRVLIPIKRTERCFRVLRLINQYMPGIRTEFYLLHVLETAEAGVESEILQDLHEIGRQILSDKVVKILIRKGNFTDNLVRSSLNHRIDLVIIAVQGEDSSFQLNNRGTINQIIRHIHTPVLLIPDTLTSRDFSIQKVLIAVDGRSSSRYDAAFAIKTARLLNASPVLMSTSRNSRIDSVTGHLELLADRYLDTASRERCEIIVRSWSFERLFRWSCNEFSPDMAAFCIQNFGYFRQAQFLKDLAVIFSEFSRPVLIVRRFEGMKFLARKFATVHRSLTEYDLSHDEPQEEINDSRDNLSVSPASSRLLGYYSSRGIEKALKRYGVFKDLERIGYPDVRVELQTIDNFRQRLLIFSDESLKMEPLMDMVIKREILPDLARINPDYPRINSQYILIEWLCLQDPKRAYRNTQAPLPGQSYPGLGMGWKVLVILEFMARRLGAAGLVNIPEYYHSARFFHRFFRFASPEIEGELLALDRDTFPHHVVDASWAVVHGLVNRDGKRYSWSGSPQILPLHPQIKAYFSSDKYTGKMGNRLRDVRFNLDIESLKILNDRETFYKSPDITSEGD